MVGPERNAKWLEGVLGQAQNAKFIFLTSHYPAWSSSSHGKVDEKGMPMEPAMLQMRQTVGPLLAKYKATAMFAGHDHTYERSEDEGVSFIISGGAGAPRYPKSKTAEKQNPHSVIYSPVLHYCLLSVSGDTCTLKVSRRRASRLTPASGLHGNRFPASADTGPEKATKPLDEAMLPWRHLLRPDPEYRPLSITAGGRFERLVTPICKSSIQDSRAGILASGRSGRIQRPKRSLLPGQ